MSRSPASAPPSDDEDRCDEVRPGAERRRLAGDHDGADRRVGLELVEGGDDLA